jgi:cell division septum initiation protein DivIVA
MDKLLDKFEKKLDQLLKGQEDLKRNIEGLREAIASEAVASEDAASEDIVSEATSVASQIPTTIHGHRGNTGGPPPKKI